eukprot:gene14985-biopygen16942
MSSLPSSLFHNLIVESADADRTLDSSLQKMADGTILTSARQPNSDTTPARSSLASKD